MRKIRIVQVITRMDWGGSPDIVRILCERLDPDRYELWLINGLSRHPSRRSADFLSRFKERVLVVPELKRDVRPISDLAAFFRLYFLFLKHRFDIVHTHTAKAGFLGRIAAKLAGVKLVVHTPHGNNFYGYFAKVFGALVLWLERLADAFTDKWIVLTGLEKKDLIAYGVSENEKIAVVPSGLEPEQYASAKADIAAKKRELGIRDTDEAVAAMVGRLEPVKGPGYFIEAAGLVLKELPAVRFLLVGEGSLKERLKRRAEESGIADRVIFLGWREDVGEIFPLIDLLVVPSLNEAVGRVILEAGYFGVPCVAFRTGGIPEIVRDGSTGVLVAPGSARELGEGILALLRDKEKRRAMGQAARERVCGEFSAENMVKKIEGLYGIV